jgi:peptidoglycan hydrolase-like protein with peptidoglycan-binding domain
VANAGRNAGRRDFGRGGDPHAFSGRRAQSLEDRAWLGRFHTTAGIELSAPLTTDEPQVRPVIYERGIAARENEVQPLTGGGAKATLHLDQAVQPAQYTREEIAPPAAVPLPQSGSRVTINGRNGGRYNPIYTPDPERNESVGVINSGVLIRVEGIDIAPLERAIHKMTGATARALGIPADPIDSQSQATFSSADSIRFAQINLRDRGYYSGPINGEITFGTRNAIRQLQKDNNLPITGELDGRTARLLGIASESGLEGVSIEIVNPRAERVDRDSIRISMDVHTQGSGWQVFVNRFVTNNNTLHVYVRGVPPRFPSGTVTDHHPFTETYNVPNITRVISVIWKRTLPEKRT